MWRQDSKLAGQQLDVMANIEGKIGEREGQVHEGSRHD
jgi:hypothetical protein